MPAAASSPQRIASLDFALAETLIAIGRPPIAIANARDWLVWVGEPELPQRTIDLGIDLDVNLELLASLDPDLILTTDYVAAQEPALSRIASVERFTIYREGNEPLARSIEVMTELGKRLGARREAEAYRTETERFFDECAARVRRLSPRPVLLVSFMDARHVRVYGRPGLYHNVLDRIGLANAWTQETNFWGFTTVGIEGLAGITDARLVTFDPVPPDALPTLESSPLWTGLPFVRDRAVSILPPVLMFGALPSARRFAGLLLDELEAVAA